MVVIIVALTASACRTPLQVAQVQPQKNTSITSEIEKSEFRIRYCSYKRSRVGEKMNSKISCTSVDLNKSGDNSNLETFCEFHL
ncbi:MAG: hypothetical protein U0T85_01495 [Cloacibacterium normanense]